MSLGFWFQFAQLGLRFVAASDIKDIKSALFISLLDCVCIVSGRRTADNDNRRCVRRLLKLFGQFTWPWRIRPVGHCAIIVKWVIASMFQRIHISEHDMRVCVCVRAILICAAFLCLIIFRRFFYYLLHQVFSHFLSSLIPLSLILSLWATTTIANYKIVTRVNLAILWP